MAPGRLAGTGTDVFFSLHRCVYVAWDSTDVDFHRASGRERTDFIDGEF